ncbi:structure-specific endonuclease subunit SLX4 isoform X2 [Hemicordylus capensis]|uniref:structure-specific endonuclease subunit SLX4 isoform X2 n=1 Tax=Hemicordylus capensis TaxID=884348 RepID=UPI0023049C8D|nr:structure-specific endonuclease subunit SLX4 isoform X2 [Hemicordylus capensis]
MAPCTEGSSPKQDPEKAREQMEERVALLLSETEDFPSTPPLPTSRLLEAGRPWQMDRRLALAAGRQGSLWAFSSLSEVCAAPGSFCAARLGVSVSPQRSDQRPALGAGLPPSGTVRPEAEHVAPASAGRLQGRVCGQLPDGGSGDQREELAFSQKEAEALQDLVELAGEGLTLTQWRRDVRQVEESGWEQQPLPSEALQSCLVRPVEEEEEERLPLSSCRPTAALRALAAAFRGMVNNPHLSDIQFQVDSGEVLYAHLFVLYARCPELMEVVDHKAFIVAEEGCVGARRVLLSDTPAEAVCAFLNYLYSGDHSVPLHVLPDVAALAARFRVRELAALCQLRSGRGQAGSGGRCGREEEEEEDGGGGEEERAKSFEALLNSMWMGEDEETEALTKCAHEEEAQGENMGEQELEEIYEFAATQCKAAAAEAKEEVRGSSEGKRQMSRAGACPRKELEEEEEKDPLTGSSVATWKGDPEPSRVCDARREEGPGTLPWEPQKDAGATRPLGEPAAEVLLDLTGTSEEEDQPECRDGAASLFPVMQVASSELSRQYPDAQEPSTEPLAKKSSRLQDLLLGERKCLGALSGDWPEPGSLPGPSPRKPSGASSPALSFSPPSTTGKPFGFPKEEQLECAEEKQALPSGQALCSPAPLPAPPHGPLDGSLIWVSDSDDEGGPGQGKPPPEASVGTLGRAAAISSSQRASPQAAREEGAGGPLVCREAAPQGKGQQLLRLSSDDEDSPAEGSGWSGGERTLVPDTPLLGQRAKAGWNSVTQGSPPVKRRTPPSPGRGKPASSPLAGLGADVVVVDDSEEEQEALMLEEALPLAEGDGSFLLPLTQLERARATVAGPCQSTGCRRPGPARSPCGGSRVASGAAGLGCGGAESAECGAHDWAAWSGEDSDNSEVLPLTQRLFAAEPVEKTPEPACPARESLPFPTARTPTPSYSIMETPELKKELSRFGVRALPKRQMVLKLKEIFQYTHPRAAADSEGTAGPAQPRRRGSPTKAGSRAPRSAVASSTLRTQPPGFAEPPRERRERQDGRQRCRGPSGAGGEGLGQLAKGRRAQAGKGRSREAAAAAPGGPSSDPVPAASQESTGSSGSDVALGCPSSPLTEFQMGTQAEEEEEEEEEESLPASQALALEAAKLEAVRHYIRSTPALCRQILLYQPFELAGLQAELKQNGIRIALGKLLDFLDAHCLTFTTAEARREKRQQQHHHHQRPKTKRGRRR